MEEDLNVEFGEENLANKLQGGVRGKISFILSRLWDYEELRIGRVKNIKT